MKIIIKKNILDLRYNKYLQYQTTAIITLVTYMIGVTIAVLTKQINYQDMRQLLIVAVLTIGMVWLHFYLIIMYKNRQEKIIKEISHLTE